MASNEKKGICVPYTIRTTPEKGRGIYADEPIRKGTVVWRHQPGGYDVHDERSLKALLTKATHDEAVYVLTHIHTVAEFPDFMVQVKDDGELINHSDQATLIVIEETGDYEIPPVASAQDVADALLDRRFSAFAAQDIQIGDELTLNYNEDPEDAAYYEALCEEYGVSWDWL